MALERRPPSAVRRMPLVVAAANRLDARAVLRQVAPLHALTRPLHRLQMPAPSLLT